MQWVLIDRVGHLAFYFLTKISGSNQSSKVEQSVKHFSTINSIEVTVDSDPAAINGWTADGWREDQTAAVHTIDIRGKVSMSGDKTIYAVYRRDATFYSGSNKATSTTGIQYYNTVKKFSLLAASSASVEALSGWTPKNWVSSGGVDVAFGAKYTDTSNVFYAKYQRNATFYHGVNKANNTVATQSYTSDNKYSLTTPALDKATDIGKSWAIQDWLQAQEDKFYKGNVTYTGSKNVFYAYYKRTITVKYSANGGEGTMDSTTDTQYYNSSAADSITPKGLKLAANKFTRTGYAFSKWSLGNAGETAGFAVGDAATKTATAQWAGYTYKVSYAKGTATGGWDATTYKEQSATYPATITLHTNNMTKNDTEKANSKATVTFNANGGSVSPASAASYIPIAYAKNGWTLKSGDTTRNYANGYKYSRTDKNGTAITLYPCFSQSDKARTTITMPTPSKTNMTCTGWWDAKSNGTKLFSCGVKYAVTKSQTVYAQWTNATANMGAGGTWYGTSIGGTSGGSDNYHVIDKLICKVKFQLLAGKTWQNMVDNADYKWPIYYEYKQGRSSYLSSKWTNEGKYTTRAALKAAAQSAEDGSGSNYTRAYLTSKKLSGWTDNNGTISTGAKYEWSPSYKPPTSAKVVYFRPIGHSEPSSHNDGFMVNLGCFATKTSTVQYHHMSSSGNGFTCIMPTDPILASSVINLSDISGGKIYIFSDTDANPGTAEEDCKIVQFK